MSNVTAFLAGCVIGVIVLFTATMIAIADPGGWDVWRVAVLFVGIVPLCGLAAVIWEWV